MLIGIINPAFAAKDNTLYTITLASTLQPITKADLPPESILNKYDVYVTTLDKRGSRWHRLRLGFFDSLSDAKYFLSILKRDKRYYDAWIDSASEREYKSAKMSRITSRNYDGTTSDTRNSHFKDKKSADLNADNKRYIIILASSLNKFKANDLPDKEVIGNHKIYTTAIKSQGRIWHRLNIGFFDNNISVNAAFSQLKKDQRFKDAWIKEISEVDYALALKEKDIAKTRVAKTGSPKSNEKPHPMSWGGSFSQFSNRDIHTFPDGSTVNYSNLFNSLGLRGRYFGQTINARTEIESYYQYTTYDDNSVVSEWRVSSMLADLELRKLDADIIIGRQLASSGGVLSRFDGVWLSHRFMPNWKYNIYTGQPVSLTSTIQVNNHDRNFIGFSLDAEKINSAWSFNTFGISQKVDGIVDRQAIGGEIRYAEQNQSHLFLIDYDTSYNIANTLVASSYWVLTPSLTLALSLESRKIPTLTTSNALLGIAGSSVGELLLAMTEDQIRTQAGDRTAQLDSTKINISYQIGSYYQLSFEYTSAYQNKNVDYGLIDPIDNSGRRNTGSITLIGRGMFKQRDITIITTRFSRHSSYDTNTFDMNVRYPLSKAWRLGPTLRIEHRDYPMDGDQIVTKPSISIDYRWLSNITFDVSLSLQHIHELDLDIKDDSEYFFNIGYRYDF